MIVRWMRMLMPKKCLELIHDLVFLLSLHFQYVYLHCKDKNGIMKYCAKYAVLDDQWLIAWCLEIFLFLLQLRILRIFYVSIGNII